MTSLAAYSIRSGCQVIFLSSANSGDRQRCQLAKLEKQKGIFYQVVSYVCPEHAAVLMKKKTAITCPCYTFIPHHITMTSTHKESLDIIQKDAFFNEILGGGMKPISTREEVNTVIAPEKLKLLAHSCIETRQWIAKLGQSLFVYVDPAYSATDGRASGTGVCVVSRLSPQYTVVLGCEQYYLSQEDLLDSTDVIAGLVAHLLANICQLHSQGNNCTHFRRIYYAVESNLSEANCVQICKAISTRFCALYTSASRPTMKSFCRYTSDKKSMKWGFQLTGTNKTKFCEKAISMINNGHILMSTSLLSYSMAENAVDTLCCQLQNVRSEVTSSGHVRYTGKLDHTNDDLFVSFCMSIGLLLNENNTDVFKHWHDIYV